MSKKKNDNVKEEEIKEEVKEEEKVEEAEEDTTDTPDAEKEEETEGSKDKVLAAIVYTSSNGEMGTLTFSDFEEKIAKGSIVADMSPHEMIETVNKLSEMYTENEHAERIAMRVVAKFQQMQMQAQKQMEQAKQQGGLNRTGKFEL